MSGSTTAGICSASPVTDLVVHARDFLIRGLLAGLLAGLVAFGVAYAVGEPSVNAAIALESAGGGGHTHAEEPAPHDHGDGSAPHDHSEAPAQTEVPRSLQSTLGLLTGTLVAGVTLGGLAGMLSALALGRFGGLRERGTALAIAAVGFVALYVVPFVAYPPNPPAVGQGDTIGVRTGLFFTTMAISVVAAVTAVVVGRKLAARWGSWYAGLAAVGGYLAVAVVAVLLLPTFDEVPASFPASILYQFRTASFVTQLALWTVLGVSLAELLHRLRHRSTDLAAAKTPYATSA